MVIKIDKESFREFLNSLEEAVEYGKSFLDDDVSNVENNADEGNVGGEGSDDIDWEYLSSLDMEELVSFVEENELPIDPDEYEDEDEFREAVAEEIGVPVESGESESDDAGEDDSIDWDYLASLDFDELSMFIEENELPVDPDEYEDEDDLRIAIANEIDVEVPKPKPRKSGTARKSSVRSQMKSAVSKKSSSKKKTAKKKTAKKKTAKKKTAKKKTAKRRR